MFRWMWSWPLDTSVDFHIDFAQCQFDVLVEDGDKRSMLIQASLQILSTARMALMNHVGNKEMAPMKTVPC